MPAIRHVHISYDADAGVWWAESDDLPGLVSEAPTQGQLLDRVMAVAPELLSAEELAGGPITVRFIPRTPEQVSTHSDTKYA